MFPVPLAAMGGCWSLLQPMERQQGPLGSSPKHHWCVFLEGGAELSAGRGFSLRASLQTSLSSITGGTNPRGRVTGSLQGFGGHSGFTSSICCLWAESRHDTQSQWAFARLCRRKSLQRHCSSERALWAGCAAGRPFFVTSAKNATSSFRNTAHLGQSSGV